MSTSIELEEVYAMSLDQQIRHAPPDPPVTPFRVETFDVAGARRLHFVGELDVSSESEAQRSIAVALGRPLNYLVLDLRGLTFADCTAFRVIEYAAAATAKCHVDLYVEADPSLKRLAQVFPDELLGEAMHYI